MPFINKTIVLQEYVEKLLSLNEDSHALILSILVCSNESFLSQIIESGIVENLMA